MRDEWYGDKRDLLKWGVLLTLAERYGAKHILQVLYYRPMPWDQIELDGETVDLPESVIKHFRSTTGICSIESQSTVEVISEEFTDRNEYTRLIIDRIQKREHRPGIVFLDPDTGLQPKSTHSLKHVLDSELTEIWESLKSGDLLVVYQHQPNRNGKTWKKEKTNQLERALDIKQGTSKRAQAKTKHQDVILLYARKGEIQRPPRSPGPA